MKAFLDNHSHDCCVGNIETETYVPQRFACLNKLFHLATFCRCELSAFGCSSVVSLLNISRPTAVSRFVMTIAVYTIKRVFRRTLTHMSEECRKAMFPLFTHAYSATTIVVILAIARSAAPSLSVVPGEIFLGARQSMRSMAVKFLSETSAAFCVSALKFRRCNEGCFSAVTLAFPRRLRLTRWKFNVWPALHNYQARKSHPNEFTNAHGYIIA